MRTINWSNWIAPSFLAFAITIPRLVPAQTAHQSTTNANTTLPGTDAFNVDWGAETNGMKSGIEILPMASHYGHPIPWADLHVLNATTNELVVYLPAEVEQRFEVSIVDSTGKELKKSKEGEKMGHAFSFPNGMDVTRTANKQMPRQRLKPGMDTELQGLDPSGLFIAKEAGQYRMTVVQRLYLLTTNITTNPPWTNYFLKPLKLAPVTVDINIQLPRK